MTDRDVEDHPAECGIVVSNEFIRLSCIGSPPLNWSTLIASLGGLNYGNQAASAGRDRYQVTAS